MFELLNKTNQFNTTGRRWTLPEVRAFFGAGGRMVVARVRDIFSDYGLTAIGLLRGAEIVQLVMSCRVFGLGVETKLLDAAIQDLRAHGAQEIVARTRRTDRNAPSREVYAAAGFVSEPDGEDRLWRLPS